MKTSKQPIGAKIFVRATGKHKSPIIPLTSTFGWYSMVKRIFVWSTKTVPIITMFTAWETLLSNQQKNRVNIWLKIILLCKQCFHVITQSRELRYTTHPKVLSINLSRIIFSQFLPPYNWAMIEQRFLTAFQLMAYIYATFWDPSRDSKKLSST